MNWTGKSSVFLITVFALALAVLGTSARAEVPLPAAGDGDEDAFFYSSFPLEGGPYIIAATYWDASETDVSGDDDSLIVVFSEPIDPDSLDLEDFVFDGIDFDDLWRIDEITEKYAVLTDASGTFNAGADSVGLIWDSVVGADGSRSKDIGMVPIHTGPVIVDAIFDQHFNSDDVESPYVDDSVSVTVIFDHPVTLVSPVNNAFKSTPEFAGGVLLSNSASGDTVTVTRNASGDSLLWTYPGISKMWLDAGDIYWNDGGSGITNSRAQKVMLQNGGPSLMAAYYNDMGTGTLDDDQIWLVYDQPIPPSSLGEPEDQYDIGWASGGFSTDASQQRQPSGADYANVLVITDPLNGEDNVPGNNPPPGGNEWIVEVEGEEHVDYQGITSTRRMARCTIGVGITRAAYFDLGDDDASNDQLHLWFSEEVNTADVTLEDFELYPVEGVYGWQDEVSITKENINGLGHVVISNWHLVTELGGDRLPSGYFIKIAADDSFDGLDSDDGCDGESLIPIMDDSYPARVQLAEVPTLTYKRYNEATDADTVFLAWEETGLVDDSDQYFLFFTNQEGTALDDLFIRNYRHNAKAVGNLTPLTVDGPVQRIALDISNTLGNVTTDGHQIEHGDELRFMLVPATYWGPMAQEEDVLVFSSTIIAGPVCPPQDFDANDDDIIHVRAEYDAEEEAWTRYVYGDANAAPCGSRVYVFDGDDPLSDNELGWITINANKSFDEIMLENALVDIDELDTLYLFAWEDGAFSEDLAIINDIVSPIFALSSPLPNADRFNPYQIYKADDYVNILLKAYDMVNDADPDSALSDLLAITADFSHLDDRDVLPAALGGDSIHAVPLVSLGYDEVDNDGDWVANDPAIDLDDDGVMDFPEPYFDENANGVFDPGETFFDVDGDDLFDGPGGSGDNYDLNLDSADPDEHGFYEIRLLAAGDEDLYNDVVKGFQVLDPVTDPAGFENFGEIQDIPVPMIVTDTYLDATTEYDEDDPPFSCEMDEVAPTVSKITELYTLGTFTEASVVGDNLIRPTDPTYNLGRYINFKDETPSDWDVLFTVAQIREAGGSWMQLTLDPPGWNIDAGIPGVEDFDDDRDADDLVDEDEDGDLTGDGLDLLDAEVVDAVQDSTADADADNGDGLYRTTDRRDNDNDAFFFFEPYYDVDGALGSAEVTQKIVWFNIDERTDNDIDDDFSGIPDAGDETETYAAQSDDNEDGIFDGEAVELTADGARMFCVFDSTYAGPFYVDAAHILGEHPGDMDGDIRALTEFIAGGYGTLDPAGVDVDGPLPGLPWGDDTVAQEFAWYPLHNNENIDFWHLAQLYYGEIPDGTQEYELRVLAYDQPGNMNAEYAVPITFTADVTPPELQLTDCDVAGFPEDFGDGVICNEGEYTLTVENTEDVVTAYFQRRISTDEGVTWGAWGNVGTGSDSSVPFTMDWDASEIEIFDVPPDYYALVEFRAYGEDEFGNVQDPDSACVAQVRVQDCQPPVTWFTLIHQTENPNNTLPVCDPPTDGSDPNPYYFRDDIGPLQVPVGPAIDVWALFSVHPDSAASCLHDVIRVVFEYRPAGAGEWTMLETITGDIVIDPDTGDTLSVDLTLPVAVTLNTEALATGSYDLRVYACDIEGNCNVETADIAMITIVDEGLRAYIEPVRVLDCDEREGEVTDYDLYAINWIHDTHIDHVLFQFYEDTNADGIDNDGNEWWNIAVDDGSSADPRGDVVLRRGTEMIEELTGRVAFNGTGADTVETFIDYDLDGYSERDPIIWDLNDNGMYDDGTDEIVLGDEAEIEAFGVYELTYFEDDEFHTGDGLFDPTEWIFLENASPIAPAQTDGALNLWSVNWDVTGLAAGDYLLRAVATDILYAVDDTVTAPTVIPTESISIDATAPTATLATVTTPDGVETAATDGLYLNGATEWFKLCAESADTDLSHIRIQFRIPGHDSLGEWNDLDVNDDNDFYADIDGIPGFSDEDEIYIDVNGDYMWDEGDLLLYAGLNGEMNADEYAATYGETPLVPLFNYEFAGADTLYEEEDNAFDDDLDDMVNEDLFNALDWSAPYCVYFPITALGLISDTNVEFRAVATDQSCNTDPDPVVLQVILGETNAPETDAVWVKLADETEIDYLPFISDGDDVTQLSADDIAEPITTLVTGEDATAIAQVDLKFRKVGDCYDLYEWENPWLSMSDLGYTTLNTSYDYPFEIDLATLVADHGYGVYEWYAEAMDNNGNVTPPYENPYQFKILTNMATIMTPAATVAPGDEFWFTAELDAPDDDATVFFMYAERMMDVVIDPTRITPDPENPTYQTLALDMPMGHPSQDAVLTINGVEGDFFATADELVADGAAGDWTYDVAAKAIEFYALPAPTDTILVSYNITGYDWLYGFLGGDVSSDDDAPYTAAWDQLHNNVPFPEYPEYTDAYDVIAVATIGDGACAVSEPWMSEGLYLMLEDELAPNAHLYGGGLFNKAPETAYWPGNPSFRSVAGLTEWKLSGVEHEFFALSDSEDVAEMNLVFTGPDTDTDYTVPMTMVDEMADYVYMTFTLYEADLPEIRYPLENVALNINGFQYPMAETEVGSGIWQVVDVPVPVGEEIAYTFAIDQDGNDWDDEIPDPRNREMAIVPPIPYGGPWTYDDWHSSIYVPVVPFWYAPGPDFGDVTSVWQVKCEATDGEGNTGSTPVYTFVYDPVPPTVDEVTAEALRFGAGDNVKVYTQVYDPVPADFDVITVSQVWVQYCPNYLAAEEDQVWLHYGFDADAENGWVVDGEIPDPETDGFDNDGDGEWDEADEATSQMAWRVMAQDDGGNWSAPVLLEFVLDETEPAAVLTAPIDGMVYAYGSTFDVTAEITESEDDIWYVLFQFDAGDGWTDIDITPEDGTDHPFDADGSDGWGVSFNTTDYLDEMDTYVRFRAVATDIAGNDDDDPMEVLTVINDVTGPTAFPMSAATTGGAEMPLTDPHTAVTGHEATIYGIAVDPSGRENLETVRVQYSTDQETWTDIGFVLASDFVLTGYNPQTVGWSIDWDTVALPEGMYYIRAIAADIDNNIDEDPIVADLLVDHTGPETLYEPITGFYNGFAPYVMYENDGVADQQSMVLYPDEETEDLAFMIVTRDDDIQTIELQWHQEDTHDLGEWASPTGGDFDFEPSLTFTYEEETYYVWWLHLPDFADMGFETFDEWADAVGMNGEMDIRALATDYAGNQNILHDAKNMWSMYTIDTGDPYHLDFNHDLDADQVASGDPVTFEIVLSDSMTDVVTVRLEYSVAGEDDWMVIDPNPATPEIEAIPLTVENLDTPFARWTGTVTWTTPYPLVQDTDYEIQAIFYDSAHNWGDTDDRDGNLVITVEDNIKPMYTKIWAVPAQVRWMDDDYNGSADNIYQDNCEDSVHDGLYVDLDGAFGYNADNDVALDLGAYGIGEGTYALFYGDAAASNVFGAATNTWPRYIDEVVLGGELMPVVSHDVFVVGRTQIDDTGLATVEFWAEDSEGARQLIGTDECPPVYGQGMYLWQVHWNTLETDEYGEPMWPDGEYTLVPIATDLEGNREDWPETDDLSGAAVVTIDNTAPALVSMTADPEMVERNTMVTLEAETDLAGQQDDVVGWYYKRSTDLNMPGSWTMVAPGWGVDDSDDSPDHTRPYVFDWDLDRMDEPFPMPDPIVGVDIDVVGVPWDIFMNMAGDTQAETAVEMYDAGQYATFRVVDTVAPVATITEVKRITGNTTAIMMPHLDGTVRARDLAYMKAKILAYDNDTEKVEFMYALEGQTEPMLIDAQVAKDPDDPYTWQIDSWDLSPLAGETLDVFAVATDDVGNTDLDPETGRPTNGPVFKLFVDYEAPSYTIVTPTDGMKECRVDSANVIYDLVFTSNDTDVDRDLTAWLYKLSSLEDDPFNWTECSDAGIVWDVNSETYADIWDVSEIASNLYDFKLYLVDHAGNLTEEIVAREVVVDTDEPWGEVTRVDVAGESFYPTMPIDITRGMTIDLWATAHDIEEGLPLNTGVAEVLFQVQGPVATNSGTLTWRDIGFWEAPDATVYEEVEASVTWNTSGEPEGDYFVRVVVKDEECNEYESGTVELTISDIVPPRARIAAFDPWQIGHGDDQTTYVDVIATGYSDSTIAEVQFQYSEDDGETWVPFGVTVDVEPDINGEHSDWEDWMDAMCDLWYATLDLQSFEVGDQVWFRAIATDEMDNQDPNPPMVLVEIVEHPDGSWDVAPVNPDPDELTELATVIEGGSDPDDVIVRAEMTDAAKRPYAVMIPPTPISQGGQAYCIEMIRMIDTEFSTSWQGVGELEWDICGKTSIFVNALADGDVIDMHMKHIWTWPVDWVLGSNGTAHVPGYAALDSAGVMTTEYLYATANVPSASGEGDADGCLLLMPSVTPELTPDEARYLTMVPRTGYAMGFLEDCNHNDADPAYPWTLSIQYDEYGLKQAAAEAGVDWETVEPYLTVRAYNWYDTYSTIGWSGEDISFVTVDTETNTITFKVSEWCYMRPHFAVFVPNWDAPVVVRSFTPWSPYGADGWTMTDVDPKILIDLNGTGLDKIDPHTIELYIDGNQVAANMPDGDFVEGNGDLDVQMKNTEGTRYQVYYQHSTNRAWWLSEGAHTLNVMFKYDYTDDDGIGDWVELPATAAGATFYVDATAPYVEFHGGWVDNPVLQNVAGYINPFKEESMLTAYMYDAGSGILVRPEHLYPIFGTGNDPDEGDDDGEHDDLIDDDMVIGDPGIKYDLWLVHDEDDQHEVDEIEERLLLHTGTADELLPYLEPSLFGEDSYVPATDTLKVGLPIVAGGRTHDIQDGDIIEVTLYSQKRIEHIDDWTEGCEVGIVIDPNVYGDIPDTLVMAYLDCYYDRGSGLHVYERGIYDWAGNSGSAYVEQRFIVDMAAPTASLVSPASGEVAPGEDFDFTVEFDDPAGVHSVSAKLVGPNGMEIEDGVEINVAGDKSSLTGTVIGGLDSGNYTVEVDVQDAAGNVGTVMIPITVEAQALMLSDTYVAPNPSNPDEYDAQIHFNVSRHADITIKVYDFAGEFVGTVLSGAQYGQGTWNVPWSGQAADGTPLANGAYLIRVEAEDGSARKTATIKAVIWRE